MSSHDFRYPREIRDAAIEWHLLLESGDITTSERAAFEDWLISDPRHADAYERAVTVWAAFGTLGHDQIAHGHFRSSWPARLLGMSRSILALPSLNSGFVVSSLAAISILVGIAFITNPGPTEGIVAELPVVSEYVSGISETKAIVLADGSNVTLGAGTRLEATISHDKRVVTLFQGVALFEVAQDATRPVSVKADAFTATALGTVFDVSNNGGTVRMSVSEGRVEAKYPLVVDQSLSSLFNRKDLTAGTQITATPNKGLSHASAFRAERFATWRQGRLRLEGATLLELIAHANRYSARQIRLAHDVGDLSGRRVTVTFDGSDIDGLFESISEILPVRINQADDGAYIISNRVEYGER